jgi:hypothetical protein
MEVRYALTVCLELSVGLTAFQSTDQILWAILHQYFMAMQSIKVFTKQQQDEVEAR